jgi:hypothetical protein
MVINAKSTLLLIAIPMIDALSTGTGLATGQTTTDRLDELKEPSLVTWKRDLGGIWCDASSGCTPRLDTVYAMSVDKTGDKLGIQIRYRDTEHAVFEGALDITRGPQQKGRWQFRSKGDGGANQVREFEGTFDGARVESGTKVALKVTMTVGGETKGRELSNAQLSIETLSLNKDKIQINGSIVAENTVFTINGGIVAWKEQESGWHLIGNWTPPPAKCSGPRGGMRTKDQIVHRNTAAERSYYAAPREVKSVDVDEALSLKRGQFVRVVEGMLSADKKEMTLTLPPLPILDHNCRLIGNAKWQQLKLAKHDAIQKRSDAVQGGERGDTSPKPLQGAAVQH